MAKIKIDLQAWSEAESDIISAKEIAAMLSHTLYTDGHKHEADVAYAIVRSIESALAWIEGGRYR